MHTLVEPSADQTMNWPSTPSGRASPFGDLNSNRSTYSGDTRSYTVQPSALVSHHPSLFDDPFGERTMQPPQQQANPIALDQFHGSQDPLEMTSSASSICDPPVGRADQLGQEAGEISRAEAKFLKQMIAAAQERIWLSAPEKVWQSCVPGRPSLTLNRCANEAGPNEQSNN